MGQHQPQEISMHVATLGLSSSVAGEIQAQLGAVGDRYSHASSWPDIVALLENDRPDLILVERTALAHIELCSLSTLTEPGRWPPLLLVDRAATGLKNGLLVGRHFSQSLPRHYRVGELCIDTYRKRAGIDERWVTLPPIQYRLLLTLAEHPGEVIDCQTLLQMVWGYEATEAEARELVKVHIRQMRRRLGSDAEGRDYIRSVRGFGYMLAPPGEG